MRPNVEDLRVLAFAREPRQRVDAQEGHGGGFIKGLQKPTEGGPPAEVGAANAQKKVNIKDTFQAENLQYLSQDLVQRKFSPVIFLLIYIGKDPVFIIS